MQKSKTLFVANYHGHDLLIFDVEDPARPQLVRQIKHAKLVSPENLDVNESGDLIAVADYDGNSLHLFDHRGQHRWTRHINLAHGTAFVDDDRHVLVTSLERGQIVKFDLDGQELVRRGSPGWQTGQFLWPTCISVNKRNEILVSDPHVGGCVLLDSKLDEVWRYGGNGPGTANLNMPYGVLWNDEETFFVTDTHKSRLLLVHRDGYISASWGFSDPNGDIDVIPSPLDEKSSHLLEVVSNPVSWKYIQRQNHLQTLRMPFLEARGIHVDWHPEYSKLTSSDGRIMSIINVGQLGCNPMYFIELAEYTAVSNEYYAIIGCPSSIGYWVIGPSGLATVVRLPRNLWACRNYFVGDHVLLSAEQIVAAAQRRFDAFQKATEGDNTDRLEIIRRHLFPYVEGSNFTMALNQAFRSELGRALWKNVQESPSPEERRRAAIAYLNAQSGKRILYLEELVFAEMLAFQPK